MGKHVSELVPSISAEGRNEGQRRRLAPRNLPLSGLEGEEFARGYIQNWSAGASIPEKSAQKIFATAAAILKAGQEKPQQQGEENAVAEQE